MLIWRIFVPCNWTWIIYLGSLRPASCRCHGHRRDSQNQIRPGKLPHFSRVIYANLCEMTALNQKPEIRTLLRKWRATFSSVRSFDYVFRLQQNWKESSRMHFGFRALCVEPAALFPFRESKYEIWCCMHVIRCQRMLKRESPERIPKPPSRNAIGTRHNRSCDECNKSNAIGTIIRLRKVSRESFCSQSE